MNLIKKMFAGVDSNYLAKSYLISIAMLGLIIYSNAVGNTNESFGVQLFTWIYVILATLLFPFATVVYDDLINLIMGGHVIVLHVVIMLIYKMVKIGLLYAFAPIIAPIGFAYVYFRNGYHKEPK